MDDVVIIGGGAAGIAAAVKAVSHGLKATLIEARHHLGGRLFSFKDRYTGLELNNGEHLILAGYEKTLDLLKQIGEVDAVEIQPEIEIPFYLPDRTPVLFKSSTYFPIKGFPGALLSFSLLNFNQRLKLINRLRSLTAKVPKNCSTVGEWLKGAGKEEIDLLWKPLTLAAMNCDIDEADLGILRNALIEGFMKGGGLGFFKKTFREIFHNSAGFYLQSKKVKVITGGRINAVECSSNKIDAVYTANGGKFRGDYYIFTIPPEQLLKIPSFPISGSLNAFLQRLEYSAIVNVYLGFHKQILPDDFGCLPGSYPQWFFRVRYLNADPNLTIYNLVISSADLRLSESGIIVKCLLDLKKTGADFDEKDVVYSRVIAHPRATVKLTPDTEKLRRAIIIDCANLSLAGDWTNTGLPASIEGAVRSGYDAVDVILN